MKKLIGTAMLAALLATSAFAELSVGVWQRVLWSPVAYNGGDVMTGEQTPWAAGRSGGVGLNWVGEDEKAGMTFTFISDSWGDFFAPDGNNLIWVKPWDWIKLSLGHWDNAGDTDISAVNTASWDWLRTFTYTENLYAENENTGALFQITPVEGLYIGVGLPFGSTSTTYSKGKYYGSKKDKDGNDVVNKESSDIAFLETTSSRTKDIAYHMFEALAADVAYTVPDVLKVMVGWRGGRNEHTTLSPDIYKKDGDFVNVGEVNVFLSLLAVEDLQLDLGARINILDSDKVGDGTSKAFVGLKAGYNITDNFSIKADFATEIKKTFKPMFQFGVGVGVGFTDSLSLVADFRGQFVSDAKDKYKDPTFSFLVGLNYACSSNAVVGIGFQGKTNGGNIGPLGDTEENNWGNRSDNFGFAVPILVNVWF